jgi:tRNA pseudouridine55 synthase
VVARLRRASGVRRIGHAGTLDPLAQGVLLVAIGRATRLIEYLAEADKAYLADVTFGVETATYDAEGEIVFERDVSHLTQEAVEAALPAFRGRITQRPPAYSAISVGGQRLYDLARQGKEVDVPLREVEITRLELREWRPPVAQVHVECSKGTYIRSIAHDLGEALGTGGHLSRLVRTRVGRFGLENVVPLEELEARLREDRWAEVAVSPETAVEHLPPVDLDTASAGRLMHGIAVPVPPGFQIAAGTLARAMGPAGELLATVRVTAGTDALICRPEKVFAVG